MFVEKSTTLEAQKKVFQVQNNQLVTVVTETCRTIPELHIPEEAPLEAKIRSLAAGVCNAKKKVAKVQFKLDLKIIELELKSSPSTSPEVREQREATVKDGVATMDAAVVDCTALFEQSMEVVMTLQEDPNL